MSQIATQVNKTLHDCLSYLRSVYGSINLANRSQRFILTISISGVIGVTLAASYCYHTFSVKRKKQTLIKSRRLIDTIPELKSPNVRIKNPMHVESILSNFIHSGKQSLQVVSDFDRTISVCSANGMECMTSNAVFENSRFVSQEIRKKFEALRNVYMPIEHDPKLTKEEKIPFMIEWWDKTFELIVETNIHKDQLAEIVRQSSTHLKEGCQWFFYTLERYDVPILIFSAGLGNIIHEWIAKQCGLFKNMKIVSNFMSFSSVTNRITGFQGNMIHVFNKNEGVLLDTEYEKLIANRPNVILLGDSPGDVEMANGFPALNNVLKIGFLNMHVEELLPKYLEIYDIVTIKDDTFNVPNAILRSIL